MSGLHAFLGARDINPAERPNQNIDTQRRVQAKMNAMGIATTISDRSSAMPRVPLPSRNQTQIPMFPPKRPSTDISKISYAVPGSAQITPELRLSNRLTDSQLAIHSSQQDLHDPFDTDVEGLDDTTILSDAAQGSIGTRPGADPISRYQPYAIRQSEEIRNEEDGGFSPRYNIHNLKGDLTEEVDDGNSALGYKASSSRSTGLNANLKGDGNVLTTLRPINDGIAAAPFVTASNKENFEIQSEISIEDLGENYSADESSKISIKQPLQEPVDYGTSSEHLISEPELTSASLEHRLHDLWSQQGSENDVRKQRQVFFSSLSIEGFEECGDLLIQKFASLVNKYKEARQNRRQITRQLEQEIQVRESLISRRRQNVDSDFVRLKKAGEDVIKGKVL